MPTKKPTTTATMQQYAEDYGYQLAFLKSDPELYRIFQNAVNGKWDATRFVAAVKASGWYKKHGEAYRQNLALKTTDPATWKQKLASQRATIAEMAHRIGAPVPGAAMAKLTEDSIMFGWNDQQIRSALAGYIKPGSSAGDAGTIRQKIRETAWRNGTTASEAFITDWQQRIARGEATIDNVQQTLRETYGAKLAPGFDKELKAGMDLYDIAQPYMQTMSQTLELNPADVDLFDPTIRKALASTMGPDGKPGSGTTSLWQFENELRQDGRFMKTKQAQDKVMAAGHEILRTFGLMGD